MLAVPLALELTDDERFGDSDGVFDLNGYRESTRSSGRALADADTRNALNHPGRRNTAETAIDGWK